MEKALSFRAWLEAGTQPPDPAEEKLKQQQRQAITAGSAQGRQGAVNAAHAVVKANAANPAIDPKKLLKHIPDEPPSKMMKKGMKKGMKK